MRILAIDVGTGLPSLCHYAVLSLNKTLYYVADGTFNPHDYSLFELILANKYNVVAIERGFLYPRRRYGQDILLNIENSAKLHRESERLEKAYGHQTIWLSQPEWSRLLCRTQKSATREQVMRMVMFMVSDLPKLRKDAHTWDALGLGVAAYLMSTSRLA